MWLAQHLVGVHHVVEHDRGDSVLHHWGRCQVGHVGVVMLPAPLARRHVDLVVAPNDTHGKVPGEERRDQCSQHSDAAERPVLGRKAHLPVGDGAILGQVVLDEARDGYRGRHEREKRALLHIGAESPLVVARQVPAVPLAADAEHQHEGDGAEDHDQHLVLPAAGEHGGVGADVDVLVDQLAQVIQGILLGNEVRVETRRPRDRLHDPQRQHRAAEKEGEAEEPDHDSRRDEVDAQRVVVGLVVVHCLLLLGDLGTMTGNTYSDKLLRKP